MSLGVLSPHVNTPANSQGILIGDKVYSEVFLAIDSSIIPEESLSSTPSMLDGLDNETETNLRILGCELIQSAGILLRLPQVAMATGQVLFQRFFYSKSFIKHSFEIFAMACVNLASKIEESPRRVRDVINVFHHLKQGKGKKSTPLVLDQNYINTKNQLIKAERRVLKELGFCVHVKHPHKIIVMYLQVLECEKNQMLVQTAWNYMNDALRTNVFVRFEPETIACACIYLAARVLQIPLPSKPHWYLVFGATKEHIREICISTMKLYSREKPNSEQLEKRVEKRKVALEEARLKAKGQNPNGTPALAAIGGFSPASKPSSPREVKMEEKSPNSKLVKESENRQLFPKSPLNGSMKKEEGKVFQNGKNHSRSRSRSRSPSRSPHRHQRSHSGTYSSQSSRSPSPRQHKGHRASPVTQLRTERDRQSDSSRNSNKRRRSRSRSRSNSRERGRDRDYVKHKHDRGHHWDHRERDRDRSHDQGRSKHQSRSHSGRRHRR
ncbi:cyclin-L1-like isoform X1 [Carassius auratus]|uniref:Cyclin-L1-like isoform X1 n=1 Tax=Carassius auratus TaxID=7957 RepID=A0A6P6RGK8_CARAU|nr:cyclin-L1-like isoform X1 [Carassius auratus]XP_026144582.1 cyclin-L1-like isoform X1 [Carassius auratus]